MDDRDSACTLSLSWAMSRLLFVNLQESLEFIFLILAILPIIFRSVIKASVAIKGIWFKTVFISKIGIRKWDKLALLQHHRGERTGVELVIIMR